MRRFVGTMLTLVACSQAPPSREVPDGGLEAPDDAALNPAAFDAADWGCTKFGPTAVPCGTHRGECCRAYVPTCRPDADVPTIQASNYDQTCDLDTDCVPVVVGDPCANICLFECGYFGDNAAINASSLTRYKSDVAAALAGTNSDTSVVCGCHLEVAGYMPPVTCSAGTCQLASVVSPFDANDGLGE